jgi:hypothetical protein
MLQQVSVGSKQAPPRPPWRARMTVASPRSFSAYESRGKMGRMRLLTVDLARFGLHSSRAIVLCPPRSLFSVVCIAASFLTTGSELWLALETIDLVLFEPGVRQPRRHWIIVVGPSPSGLSHSPGCLSPRAGWLVRAWSLGMAAAREWEIPLAGYFDWCSGQSCYVSPGQFGGG